MKPIDKIYLVLVIGLTVVGFSVFASASLSYEIYQTDRFTGAMTIRIIGVILGFLGFYIASRIPYQFWRTYAWILFGCAVILNLLVFIPGIGASYDKANRWISLGGLSIQPSEFLKIATILYVGAWLAYTRDKIGEMRHGLGVFIVLSSIVGLILIGQSDTDTMLVIVATTTVMYFIAGGKIRHIALIGLIGLIIVGGLALTRPYIKERIVTYINPSSDIQGAGWQIHNSLKAIGSGGAFGRGFGQSLQKFYNLPEKTSDSIFAVYAEEFGFVGSIVLIGLFVALYIRSVQIAKRVSDMYASLIVMGIATLIVIESFMNMASMVGIIPLSGMPLLFVSHGTTALVVILCSSGIIANISRKSNT